MATYILRRILIGFPVLLGITVVSFIALSLAPGDPLTARMDPSVLAQVQRNPQLLEERRHELGLDQPVPVRYLLWLRSAVQGDLGYSIQSHRPISEELAKRIPPTLALMIVAVLIAILVGIPLGILSALRPVLEGRLRADHRHPRPVERAHVRPGSGRHLHLRRMA